MVQASSEIPEWLRNRVKSARKSDKRSPREQQELSPGGQVYPPLLNARLAQVGENFPQTLLCMVVPNIPLSPSLSAQLLRSPGRPQQPAPQHVVVAVRVGHDLLALHDMKRERVIYLLAVDLDGPQSPVKQVTDSH